MKAIFYVSNYGMNHSSFMICQKDGSVYRIVEGGSCSSGFIKKKDNGPIRFKENDYDWENRFDTPLEMKICKKLRFLSNVNREQFIDVRE